MAETAPLEKIVYPEVPIRVEYSLTEKGRALEPGIRGIQEWAVGRNDYGT